MLRDLLMEKLESQSKRVDLSLEAQAQALEHGVGGYEDLLTLDSDGLVGR